MAIAIRSRQALTRRRLLVRSASTLALAGLGSLAKPYLSRAADRPQISCGIQSGDVSQNSAMVWARADRPARMQVEYSALESFNTLLGAASADALPDHEFAAKLLLEELPPGQDIFPNRSGNSSRARCMPAPGPPANSTIRSGRRRHSRRAAAQSRAKTSRHASDCSFSVASTSTAAPVS